MSVAVAGSILYLVAKTAVALPLFCKLLWSNVKNDEKAAHTEISYRRTILAAKRLS
jgi:hypothetical protein